MKPGPRLRALPHGTMLGRRIRALRVLVALLGERLSVPGADGALRLLHVLTVFLYVYAFSARNLHRQEKASAFADQ